MPRKGGDAMTSFEERGVNRQYSAGSVREAENAFQKSCELCTTQGKFISCDRCAIAYINQLVKEMFIN
jgi:hypothetical protein